MGYCSSLQVHCSAIPHTLEMQSPGMYGQHKGINEKGVSEGAHLLWRGRGEEEESEVEEEEKEGERNRRKKGLK